MSTKNAIWSLGILTLFLMTGMMPKGEKILDDSELTVPEHITGSLREFISKALQKDPSKRIGLKEASNFFEGVAAVNSGLLPAGVLQSLRNFHVRLFVQMHHAI